jgi:hypothetical protein
MTTKEPALGRRGDEVWVGPEWLGVAMDEVNSRWQTVGEDFDHIEKLKVAGGYIFRSRITSGGQEHPVTAAVALCFVPSVPDPEPTKKKKRR